MHLVRVRGEAFRSCTVCLSPMLSPILHVFKKFIHFGSDGIQVPTDKSVCPLRLTRNVWQSPACSPPGTNAPRQNSGVTGPNVTKILLGVEGSGHRGVNARIHVAILSSVVECQRIELAVRRMKPLTE